MATQEYCDPTQIQTKLFPPRLREGTVKMTFYEDDQYPYVFEPFEDHIEKLKTFEIRNDDVILYTHPRSGTHWIFRVLDMLMRGKAEYRDFHVDQVRYDHQLLEDLDKLPSPRILHSHLPKRFQPQQLWEKKPKIVHMYRNPKAVAVSLYHVVSVMVGYKGDVNMDLITDNVKKAWSRFMDGITESMKNDPDLPIFNVSYEEMIMNPLQIVKRLAEFLGIAVSDVICEQIHDACSFDKQKTAEDKMDSDIRVKMNLFRQGGIDNWKKEMTVAQSEQFDDMLRERKDRYPTSYDTVHQLLARNGQTGAIDEITLQLLTKVGLRLRL